MKSLQEVRKNNIAMAFMGLNFTRPVFRLLAGQTPYEVPNFTIYGKDAKKRQKKFKKILEKNEDGFVVIVRGDKAELEDVLFVPSTKEILAAG
jgi:hypothetical protein